MQIRLDTVHWSCQSCVISPNVTESYYVLMEDSNFFFDKWAWEIVNLIWSNIWKAYCDKILVFSYHKFMNCSKMSGVVWDLKKNTFNKFDTCLVFFRFMNWCQMFLYVELWIFGFYIESWLYIGNNIATK